MARTALQLQPVARHAPPGYPTRAALDAHPNLLRAAPHRWQRNAAVMAVLLGVVPGFAGCIRMAPPAMPVSVAGSVMPPPTMLSVAEAEQIIREEAKREGIILTPHKRNLAGVPLQITDLGGVQQTVAIKVEIDGSATSKGHQLAYKWVSDTTTSALEAKYPTLQPAVKNDNAAAAALLQTGLDRLPGATEYVVFYDDESVTDASAKSAALRNQVRAFLTWCKQEGVL